MAENIFKIWSQLGVGFGESFSTGKRIDLEKTLLLTLEKGRDESRLLFGMIGWLLKHHELVNSHRLILLLKNSKASSLAILGAICDIVLKENPRSIFLCVRNHCRPLKKKVFLFRNIKKSKVVSDLNKQESHSIWRKWNLISRELDTLQGAIMERSFVLSHNKNLIPLNQFNRNPRKIIDKTKKNISHNRKEVVVSSRLRFGSGKRAGNQKES